MLRLAEHLILLRVALGYVHIAGLWLVTGALAWMLGDAVDRRLAANSWHLAAGLLAPMAAVQAVLWAKARERWPVERWPDAYLAVAAGGLVGVLLAAVFFLNLGSSGLARPLPFIPLLNPLELALAAALLTALRWRQAVQLAAGAAAEGSLLRQANALAGGRGFVALLAGLVFLFANGVLLRTLHHATGVRWDAGALFASDTVQMAVSLFWALLGLVLTYLASRNGRRVLWIAGATLLGLVVAKLFLVDMASTGTVARIVSFLGAGVLLVIVGYLSPLPPAREDKS